MNKEDYVPCMLETEYECPPDPDKCKLRDVSRSIFKRLAVSKGMPYADVVEAYRTLDSPEKERIERKIRDRYKRVVLFSCGKRCKNVEDGLIEI